MENNLDDDVVLMKNANRVISRQLKRYIQKIARFAGLLDARVNKKEVNDTYPIFTLSSFYEGDDLEAKLSTISSIVKRETGVVIRYKKAKKRRHKYE